MTWTYGGTPGRETPEERRDAVRSLVGDVVQSDQQIQDEEIAFFLAESRENVYSAASLVARNIAAKYARLVDSNVDSGGIQVSYSQRQANYESLANSLKREASRRGEVSIFTVGAGGISNIDVDRVRSNSDRVKPVFSVGMLSEDDSASGRVK